MRLHLHFRIARPVANSCEQAVQNASTLGFTLIETTTRECDELFPRLRRNSSVL